VLGGKTDAAEAVPAAQAGLLGSLRHPVLWGEFTALAPLDRTAVLAGQADAIDRLAQSFLERFCWKTGMRQPHLLADGAIAALRRICRADPGSGLPRGAPAQRQRDWCGPASAALSVVQADDLYNEAWSYGLITEDEPGLWRWRHLFLYDYLRRQ
jgi:hypothetical protein